MEEEHKKQVADCEESMKKELKDFDRAAKSEVGGRGKESRRYERRKGIERANG